MENDFKPVQNLTYKYAWILCSITKKNYSSLQCFWKPNVRVRYRYRTVRYANHPNLSKFVPAEIPYGTVRTSTVMNFKKIPKIPLCNVPVRRILLYPLLFVGIPFTEICDKSTWKMHITFVYYKCNPYHR